MSVQLNTPLLEETKKLPRTHSWGSLSSLGDSPDDSSDSEQVEAVARRAFEVEVSTEEPTLQETQVEPRSSGKCLAVGAVAALLTFAAFVIIEWQLRGRDYFYGP
jgi:hypothetical protein